MDFFNVVAPYCRDGRLDHDLIGKICQDTGIGFIEAFEWLTFILKTAQTRDENKRTGSVKKPDEKES